MGKRIHEPLRPEDKRPLNRTNLKNLAGIFKFVLPYKWMFALGILSLLISSLTVLSFPYFAGMLLDIASGKPVVYFTSINQVALALISILILQSIVSFTRVYTFAITSERTLVDLREAVYKKMIWSPLSFFESSRV
jgi:ATP-binding cassette subfamily B protein